jgi:hypothetical protein
MSFGCGKLQLASFEIRYPCFFRLFDRLDVLRIYFDVFHVDICFSYRNFKFQLILIHQKISKIRKWSSPVSPRTRIGSDRSSESESEISARRIVWMDIGAFFVVQERYKNKTRIHHRAAPISAESSSHLIILFLFLY